MRRLHNRKILITAGPTMARIDDVRVISNIASGRTGELLARELSKAGARVTLLMGGDGVYKLPPAARLRRFRFFDDLKTALEEELKGRRYDAVVHAAAVSDYLPLKKAKGKISSGLGKLTVTLTPAPKLIDLVRRAAPETLLVGFKFEPQASPAALMREARALGRRSGCDLVVANTVDRKGYRAFVVSPGGMVPEAGSREELAGLLVMYLETYFMKNPRGAHRCSCGACSRKKNQ